MSRIGRKAITLPKGVDVTVNGQHVTVKGAKGTLEMDVMHNISVAVADGTVSVTRANDDKAVRAAHGMTRALINNMVVGVTEGFQKVLEIVGVGDLEVLSLCRPALSCINYDTAALMEQAVELLIRYRESGPGQVALVPSGYIARNSTLST